jgi:hypothetical protein
MTSQFKSMPIKGSMRPEGLAQLFNTRLPLNRKEAFFTATVLPAIICADSFAHFDRFLNLLGLRDIPINITIEQANIQFFTEYSLAESIYDDQTVDRFPDAPREKDRPDLMILIEGSEPLLIAVEGKLYASTQASALNQQMNQQERDVISYLRKRWPKHRPIHAALLPAAMKKEFGGRGPKLIVTWEEILDKYKDVESVRYFHEILRIALRDYETLRAKSSPSNGDGTLTGAEILLRHQKDDLEFQTMGRQGGIDGGPLNDDIAKNRWRKQRYYVRKSSLHTTNWFLVSDFVALVSRKNLITMFGQVLETARDVETDDAAFGRRVRKLLAEQGGVDALAAQCEAASQPTE